MSFLLLMFLQYCWCGVSLCRGRWSVVRWSDHRIQPNPKRSDYGSVQTKSEIGFRPCNTYSFNRIWFITLFI